MKLLKKGLFLQLLINCNGCDIITQFVLIYVGTHEVTPSGSGGQASFYYQKFPCGGMDHPLRLEIKGLAASNSDKTNPSNQSKSLDFSDT